MTEAIFGLIGIIIGGVLQTGANWWMERRREDWAARKAGRLLAPAFGRSQFILNAVTKVDLTWGAIALEVDQCLERWPEHADVLAGAIEQDD